MVTESVGRVHSSSQPVVPASQVAASNPPAKPMLVVALAPSKSEIAPATPSHTKMLAPTRSEAVSSMIRRATSAQGEPFQIVRQLPDDVLDQATASEKIAMIRHIVNGTGQGFWGRNRVDGDEERAVLRVLSAGDDTARGAMMQALISSGLESKLHSSIDGANYQQFKSFLRQNVWSLERAEDVASTMARIGISRDMAGTVDTLSRLRSYRGEEFAERVVAQLYAGGAFQSLLPFVYWSATRPACDSVADVMQQAAWKVYVDRNTVEHRHQLEQFLRSMPRPNGADSPTAARVRADFERHHDAQRLYAMFDAGVCLVEAMAAETRRAEARAEEARRHEEELRRERSRPSTGGDTYRLPPSRSDQDGYTTIDDGPSRRSDQDGHTTLD